MENIKQFTDRLAYNAAGLPTLESRVSQIISESDVEFDGINIRVENPNIGDAVYGKDGKVFYFKGGDSLNHQLLVALGFLPLGQVGGHLNGKVIYIDKDITTAKFLDVSQYAWTDVVLTGEETEKTIGIRCSKDWANNTTVTFTYTATTLAEAASAILTAIEDKLEEIEAGSAEINLWHAYADDENNRVIVQRDSCNNNRFYNCSGLTHITWEDMPEISWYIKNNGSQTNRRGLMNIARGVAFWSTNGRDLTENVSVGGETVNTNPMKESEFNNSSFASEIRSYYKTYEAYLIGEFGIIYPLEFGCFADKYNAKELTLKYGNSTAITKSGSLKYKFPALHYALTIDRGVDGLKSGDIYLNGVHEGTQFMKDENLSSINDTRRKMGHTLISNRLYRWFALRRGVADALFFSSVNGTLNDDAGTFNAFQVQGVALL